MLRRDRTIRSFMTKQIGNAQSGSIAPPPNIYVKLITPFTAEHLTKTADWSRKPVIDH